MIWDTELGMKFLTPRNCKHPEPMEFGMLLREIADGRRVADVGCGTGRLCRLFDRDRYIGYDINPHAIKEARKTYPGYAFDKMPAAVQHPVVLYHTVLLHIPEDKVKEMIENTYAQTLIISEIMSAGMRNTTLPPYAYNRDPDWYVNVATERRYDFIQRYDFVYDNNRYGENHKLNVLVFER